jgi:secreted trypsin-like serine protease
MKEIQVQLLRRMAVGTLIASSVIAGSAQVANAAPDDDVRPQIVGGTAVPDGKYRFMASLQFKNGKKFSHFCGGSLIDARGAILTAAHCVEGTTEKEWAQMRVVVGRSKLSGTQGQVRKIAGVSVYPGYTKNGRGDAALVFLDKQVTGIKAIELVTPGTDALERPGRKVVVSGWGVTSKDPAGPGGEPTTDVTDRMREVTVPIVSDNECRVSYGKNFDAKTEICAGRTGKDSCQGDSGGPLFSKVPGRPDEFIQLGVVSWGEGCAASGFPGVYTRISNEKVGEWIAGFGQDAKS